MFNNADECKIRLQSLLGFSRRSGVTWCETFQVSREGGSWASVETVELL